MQQWKELYGINEAMGWSMISGEEVTVAAKKTTVAPIHSS